MSLAQQSIMVEDHEAQNGLEKKAKLFRNRYEKGLVIRQKRRPERNTVLTLEGQQLEKFLKAELPV